MTRTEVEAEHKGLRFDVLAETPSGTIIGIECKEWTALTPALAEKAARQISLLEGGVVDRAFIVAPHLNENQQIESIRSLAGLKAAIQELVDSEPDFRFRGTRAQTKSRSDRKRIFVAMPFAAHFEDTYYLGIAPVAEKADASCSRADEPRFNQHILDTIYREIRLADVVVADLSGANPNVTYELGLAHAQKKPSIHISMTPPPELPFDFQQYPIAVYEQGKVHILRKSLEDLIVKALAAGPAAES